MIPPEAKAANTTRPISRGPSPHAAVPEWIWVPSFSLLLSRRVHGFSDSAASTRGESVRHATAPRPWLCSAPPRSSTKLGPSLSKPSRPPRPIRACSALLPLELLERLSHPFASSLDISRSRSRPASAFAFTGSPSTPIGENIVDAPAASFVASAIAAWVSPTNPRSATDMST